MPAAYSISGFTANLKTLSDKLNQKDYAVEGANEWFFAAVSIKNIILNLEAGSHKLDQDLEAAQQNFLLRGFFKKKKKKMQQRRQI